MSNISREILYENQYDLPVVWLVGFCVSGDNLRLADGMMSFVAPHTKHKKAESVSGRDSQEKVKARAA